VDCAGRGSKRIGAVTKCPQCRGSGIQILIRPLGPGMMQQIQAKCDLCMGRKEIVADKDRCETCQGKKVINRENPIEIRVEPGMKEGQTVRLPEAANQEPDAETGDIIAVLVEARDDEESQDKNDEKDESENHDHKMNEEQEEKKENEKKENEIKAQVPRLPFKRLPNGQDLIAEYKLSLIEALLGYEIAFRHLDDRVLILKSPPDTVTSAGDLVTIASEGMPILKRGPYDKGDLYIKFSIVMPQAQDLGSLENKVKLRSILPKIPDLPSNLGEREEYIAKPHDKEAQAAKYARDRAQRNSHEHDDDEESGPRTAECRTQ